LDGQKNNLYCFVYSLACAWRSLCGFSRVQSRIDFSGGAMAYVAFKQKPPLDSIRGALAKQGINRDSIILQDISNGGLLGGGAKAQQVLIRLPQAAAEGAGGDINVGKIKISNALHSLFAADVTDKTDVNATGSDSLREKLIAWTRWDFELRRAKA